MHASARSAIVSKDTLAPHIEQLERPRVRAPYRGRQALRLQARNNAFKLGSWHCRDEVDEFLVWLGSKADLCPFLLTSAYIGRSKQPLFSVPSTEPLVQQHETTVANFFHVMF